jgi:Ser/Thr protein kinase RdoA (MazF antagonist)
VDDLVRAVTNEFGLGDPFAIRHPAYGRPDVWLVTTASGTFVVKQLHALWRARLYDEVQRRLSARGVRQARLLHTPDGSVISREGYAVQELLPGEVVLRPTPRQRHRVFAYLSRYDSALADLSVPPELDADDTFWSKTASTSYLVNSLPELLERHIATTAGRAPLIDAIAVVRAALPRMARLPVQLVHGDVGPDNVLLDGDDVVAIIDFTPYHEPPLFSLSTALYWYYVYGKADGADLAGIELSVESYGHLRPWSDLELAMLPAMLVRESLRRFAIPLVVAEAEGRDPSSVMVARHAAALAVVCSLPELSVMRSR